MPEARSATSTGPDGPVRGGVADVPPAASCDGAAAAPGPNAFALPASHSARLAQAAAATTGLLALLILGLGFVDLREPGGDPAPPPAAALDRPEVDLPSLMKPVRSEIPRFHGEALRDDAPAEAPEPAAAPAPTAPLAPALAREPAEAVRGGTAGHAADVAFAGVWGPDDSACTPRTNRAGYLPAVITAEGAFAGETSCAFRNAKAVPGGWSVSAACRSPKGRWTTQVRLTVAGRRLTWSSARGTQTYVRCGASAAG